MPSLHNETRKIVAVATFKLNDLIEDKNEKNRLFVIRVMNSGHDFISQFLSLTMFVTIALAVAAALLVVFLVLLLIAFDT